MSLSPRRMPPNTGEQPVQFVLMNCTMMPFLVRKLWSTKSDLISSSERVNSAKGSFPMSSSTRGVCERVSGVKVLVVVSMTGKYKKQQHVSLFLLLLALQCLQFIRIIGKFDSKGIF